MVRTLDSQSREPGFESCCYHFEAWVISFTPRCSSSFTPRCSSSFTPRCSSSFTPRCSSSLGCINEYLAIDNGEYVNEYLLRSNISEPECFPEKLNEPGGGL